MPGFAEWIATAAFVLSLTSLAWQIYRTRPALHVQSDVILDMRADDGAVTYSFAVTVINYGGSPITLTTVGWQRESDPEGARPRPIYNVIPDPGSPVDDPGSPTRTNIYSVALPFHTGSTSTIRRPGKCMASL